jgi:hypothetical protein
MCNISNKLSYTIYKLIYRYMWIVKQFGTYIEATRIILKSKSKDRVIIIEVLAW